MTMTIEQGWPRTSRAVIGAVLTLVVLAAGVSWFAFRATISDVIFGPSLTTPIQDRFGISLPSTRAGQAFTIGAMSVCLSSPGVATIDRVTATGATQGLSVAAFAVRPLSPNLYGAEPVTLAASGFGGGRQVRVLCTGNPGGEELAVQLDKTRSLDVRQSGLEVSWHSGRRSGTFTIPAHIVLCQGANQDTPRCDPMAQP